MGFSQFRVRHHGDVARLEIPQAEFSKAIEQHDHLQNRIRQAGYSYVALDLGGFRSGSLNETLTAEHIAVVNIHTPEHHSH